VNSEASEPDSSGLRSVVAGIALVGCVLLIVATITSSIIWSRHGANGLLACLVAAGVCWVSASAALLITAITAGGPQAVAGLFMSIAVRTGVPLGAAALATTVGGPLADAGLFGLIVIHYLAALVVETAYAASMVSARARGAR
jgi:hypothetical protein